MLPFMLNIVIISPGFAVDENDHLCIPFLQLYIKELQKKEVRITVIATQYPQKENYQWHDIEIITVAKNKTSLLSKLFFGKRLRRALDKIHKKNKIDVI